MTKVAAGLFLEMPNNSQPPIPAGSIQSDPPPFRFFVFLVESPSAPDLYHKRSEAEVVERALRLNRIYCATRLTINRTAFFAALQFGLKEEMDERPGAHPFLHVSCHGSDEGIQLSSGEVISWSELADVLAPINKALSGRLVIMMSCCQGYAGIRMAMNLTQNELAFFALVGSPEKPTWAETCIGFATFYHQLAIGKNIVDAVDAMCIASGKKSFFVEWGEATRQHYINYLGSSTPEQASRELDQAAQNSPAADPEEMCRLEKGK